MKEPRLVAAARARQPGRDLPSRQMSQLATSPAGESMKIDGTNRVRIAVKFCGRDGQVAEVRARLRMLLAVIIQSSLHDDRLKRRPQRSSCQGSSRRCYANFPDGKGCGVSKGGRDPHREVFDVPGPLPSRSRSRSDPLPRTPRVRWQVHGSSPRCRMRAEWIL
jgi:hypothetical protein